ncbi:tRNA guanosine(34) transglycosylase Tgt [Candidatus Woesearchaeota archaeon]|nr:tRNA guanosine(34) transglycosylase Tgt [Candidatus Woesearchaeota archaeon]
MFKLDAEQDNARAGILKTAHGRLKTPFFMAVATKGAVKYAEPSELYSMGTQALISNAYLLWLNPGIKVIEKAGGLHKYMNWKKGSFTDSGGFQMIRESFFLSVRDQGVKFRSPFDGKSHIFTPEDSIEMQNRLGSDVAMVLDDVPPWGSSKERIIQSVKNTTAWAKRCADTHSNSRQLMFAISQGGTYTDLRKKSTQQLADLDFDGYGIGGLCFGEPIPLMNRMVRLSSKILPREKPRYLMGVGSPAEIVEAVAMGVDIFDSVFPTRNARHGCVFTHDGPISIDKKRYLDDYTPIDLDCNCRICREYTKSYICHLLRSKEPTGMKLVTVHNLSFIQDLMRNIRLAITEEKFERFRKDFVKRYRGRSNA